MMLLPKRTRWVGFIAIFAIALVFAGLYLLRNRPPAPYDPDYDTGVANPGYTQNGPTVLYDEAHRNTHTADGAYKPFVDLIQSDGYILRVNRERLSSEALSGASVLLIVGARGSNETDDGPAFSESEIGALAAWIRSGGSLLLIADHWPYGPAVVSLARGLGVDMGTGLVEDPEHHEPTRGASHIVFTSENGLLLDHPVLRGRTDSEHVERILTFTGTSILGPPLAVPFLSLSPAAMEYPPTPARVEKKGGDVRVMMDYGEPVSASGRAQGIALELEKGRVVILGEAGMLRAQRDGDLRVGMNVSGYDNRQLALNIMHWLSRIL